jgi:uncharacterized protein YqhQ
MYGIPSKYPSASRVHSRIGWSFCFFDQSIVVVVVAIVDLRPLAENYLINKFLVK